MALLDIRELSFRYPKAQEDALSNLDFSVERGEFITLIGPTGSGKSTLLRLIKPELRTNGSLSGEILIDGLDVAQLSTAESARRIGFVAQNPEEQIVTDKVWHELAFTLENLGAKRNDIARRIAEVAAYFGIESWYHRSTAELSGGQKQILNLACVMTADPDILILDEPTAQLDPVFATRFIDILKQLNRETGLAVIISEHRTEELIPISDKLMILDGGRIAHFNEVRDVAASMRADSPYIRYMPTSVRFYAMTGGKGACPLSVGEGRRYLHDHFNNTTRSLSSPVSGKSSNIALEIKDTWFRYDKNAPDILRGLNMTVSQGEVFAVLGSNGAGKSTAVAVAAGLRKPYHGSVKLFGKKLRDYHDGSLYRENISLLPQDVESVFLRSTVRDELKGCEKGIEQLDYDLTPLFDRHPYDLSGGERQLVALCKALATEPRLLILDEPSKGLDAERKRLLIHIIKRLKHSGVTVLMVSHDVEFAALCADRCGMLFDGALTALDDTAAFLSNNRFYTTAASRMTRGYYDGAYTVERAAELALKNGGRA